MSRGVPFNALVEVEIAEVLQGGELQVQVFLEKQQRRIWIPRDIIQDEVGGRVISVGQSIRVGDCCITIKMPYYYAKLRGLVKKYERQDYL